MVVVYIQVSSLTHVCGVCCYLLRGYLALLVLSTNSVKSDVESEVEV